MNRGPNIFQLGVMLAFCNLSSCAAPTTKPDDPPKEATGCQIAAECANLDGFCLRGICVDGSCIAEPANEFGACNDDLFCTINDICQNGRCIGTTSRHCPAANDCSVGACDEEKKSCVDLTTNEGAPCDDGNACTLSGTCTQGKCLNAPPTNCGAIVDPCLVGSCDPTLGCILQSAPDGTACDDGKNDFCSAGRCLAGKCTPAPANEGMACNDEQFCTVGETCHDGVCQAQQAKNCQAPSACWIASCNEALDICESFPGNDGSVCEDGDSCTIASTCSAGACLGGFPSNDKGFCDDGLSCTTNEVCNAGSCIAPDSTNIYFVEHFANNAQGWILGPEWEIGPAKVSMAGMLGADPPADHTLTADNGLAGIVIGGSASPFPHPFHYLQSPAFDTANASGNVVLSFYRWLNSDSLPRMNNTVEVWDGSSWVILWQSGFEPQIQDSPPLGAGWTFIQHDVTAYKNSAMRLRFGFSSAMAIFKVAGWNVDDIVVADSACP